MKDYLRVSSLGSYFGVGFNDPAQQFKYDMDIEKQEFDEASQARVNLGVYLEDASLNYFENALGIVITDRNTKTLSFYDGKLHGKLDGMTVFNGEKTVVENKVSNSQSGRFTEDTGYEFQVQAYMYATNTKQALLLGLYQGKPIYRLVARNEEMIKDILTMTDFILDYASGMESWENYPVYLIEKYDGKKEPKIISTVTEDEVSKINRLLEIDALVSPLLDEKDAIKEYFSETYDEGKIEVNDMRLSISQGSRAGGYDMDRLSIEHPEIDYSKYLKPSTSFKTIRYSVIKKKK